MNHECPASGCARSVPPHMLTCRNHWYMVPAPLRSDVWNAWAEGAGAGSAEHMEAMDAAIEAVNRMLGGAS